MRKKKRYIKFSTGAQRSGWLTTSERWSQSQKGNNDTWAKSRRICRNLSVVGNGEGVGNISTLYVVDT